MPYKVLTLGFGHSSHCNCYKLQKKILNSCDFLVSNNTFQKIEQDLIFDMLNYKNTDN